MARRLHQFSRQVSLIRTYLPTISTIWAREILMLPVSHRQVHAQVAIHGQGQAGVRLYSSSSLRYSLPPFPPPSNSPNLRVSRVNLEKWYESIPTQCKQQLPLLSSLQRYQESLPVREHNGAPLALHEHPIWVTIPEMTLLVEQLEHRPANGARASVKYFAAPPQSGKTAIVLHAFMKSYFSSGANGFKFYLYLAFGNNGCRYFQLNRATPVETTKAEDQGAQFMLECLKVLVDNPTHKSWPYEVQLQNTPSFSEGWENLRDFFQSRFGTARVLVHLDEHRHMCYRDDKSGERFSRGALGQLARVPNVTVIATFTDVPPLPPAQSSQVCREPVILPSLNIDALPELQELYDQIPPDAPRDVLRLLATLKFKLAIKLKQLGLSGVHRRGIHPEVDNFFTAFHRAQQKFSNISQLINACIDLCSILIDDADEIDVNAAKLLLGVKDAAGSTFHRQIQNLVVNDSRFTCSIPQLLSMVDPSCRMYKRGRDVFQRSLQGPDYLAHTPLEAGYIWTLSVSAALSKQLTFGKRTVDFDCLHLEPGGIFSDGHIKSPNFQQLAKGTMYYADEREGKATHPLADIFFRDDDGNIVLIDITGGKQVGTKKSSLSSFIAKVATPEQKLIGVVIAPNYVEKDNSTSWAGDNVHVVCGLDARRLLFGLSQVFAWFNDSR